MLAQDGHPVTVLAQSADGVSVRLAGCSSPPAFMVIFTTRQMFQSGTESAGFARLKWMYDGIEPSKLFQ